MRAEEPKNQLILAATGMLFLLLTVVSTAQTPTPGYHMIYGNRDGTPIEVRLGQRLYIPLWGATPPGANDSIVLMHNPLSTDNAIISARLGGTFPGHSGRPLG